METHNRNLVRKWGSLSDKRQDVIGNRKLYIQCISCKESISRWRSIRVVLGHSFGLSTDFCFLLDKLALQVSINYL